jgi:hypothetical protein
VAKLFTCNHFVFIFYPDSTLPFQEELASFTTERIFRFASALLDIAIQCNDENRSTIMKMNKLATILLTTTLTLASGAALAASNSNGAANAAADAGAVAPGAKENLQPNNVNNNDINTGNTNAATGSTGTNTTGTTGTTSTGGMLHSNGGASTSADGQHMDKDDIHKNSMCKDGRCPDVNKKVETGDGMNNDVDTKTDGTSQ